MTDRFLLEELARLEGLGLLREPDDGSRRTEALDAATRAGVPLLDASSNDYLGLAASIVSRETLSAWGVSAGSGASRLIHGTRAPHLELEHQLADWVRQPSALLFASGYAANAGLLSALGVPGSLIISDALNHASLIDGCRLSRATVRVVPHLDLAAVERELERARTPNRWVVTESYFSMDGDGPDLPALRALCDRYEAGLVVDEAHALGVFGPEGAGRCLAQGVRPDVLVGTLGKAVGVHGAFVAGSSTLRRYLWNRARSFVFSTAPSPALAALALLHVKHVRAAEDLRATLAERSAQLREALAPRGLPPLEHSFGPIVPLVLGDNESVLTATAALATRGILVQGIRPPTVPKGSARLRLTVSASMSSTDVERLAKALDSLPRPRPTPPPTSVETPPAPRRIVVLGTGTEVGKTHVGVLLARRLREAGASVLALKPVESGSITVTGPDAAALAAASGREAPGGAWTFVDALSPHLAARHAGRHIQSAAVKRWVDDAIASVQPSPPSHVLIETAGGTFSPLNENETNFDLAVALEPAFWILVAPDSLGVLHDTTATLTAMAARGRKPDVIVMSAARPTDPSTGSNAAELARLGMAPATVIARDQEDALEPLLRALLGY
ncbi:MAG TPA: aminotransferase class I/II-fold pyridoxal phosphate-dependent enzyme [Polyangiaceae bacterium]|nr:aminotransferase class I/II-fold pyridoxal phosphate-dependent enzyme [Polyangiaceae bacterium]